MIRFAWNIHFHCNYRCPYCWFHGAWEELKSGNRNLDAGTLLKHWRRIYDRYGRVHVEILGGEPLIYPGFADFVKELAAMHEVGFTTNLSVDIDDLINAGLPLTIGMSFHPLFGDLESFFARAVKVRERGLRHSVLYVAYPPQIGRIPELKERFSRAGFDFSVLTFWGEYQGRRYPDSYTPEEREIIGLSLGVHGDSKEKYQLEPVTTRGKACAAGQVYAVVHPNGDAYRCGGGKWADRRPFGNIFSEDFALLDRPRPCASEHCPCNEWIAPSAGGVDAESGGAAAT